MARVGTIARAVLRGLGIGMLGIVALISLAYLVLTQTPFGRQQVLTLALDVVNGILPGTLEVEELSELGPYGTELRGIRLRSPQGEEVASADRVAAGLLSLTALFDGHIHVGHARVDGLHADLGELELGRGFLGAVVPPSDGSGAPEGGGGSPIKVTVNGIRVRDSGARMNLAATGPMRVEHVNLQGTFTLDEAIAAQVDALSADYYSDAYLAQDTPLHLNSVQGRWIDAGTDSHATLETTYAGTSLAVELTARSPTDPAFESTPLAGHLMVKDLHPQALAAWVPADVRADLRGPVAVHAEVHGTLQDVQTKARIDSPGGTLNLQGQLKDETARVQLKMGDFRPQRVYRSAPEVAVGLHADAQAVLKDAPLLTLKVTDGTLNGTALPTADATAIVDGDVLRDVVLKLEGYGGGLSMRGKLDLEKLGGSGHLALEVPDVQKLPGAVMNAVPRDVRAQGGGIVASADGHFSEQWVDARGLLRVRDLNTTQVSIKRLTADLVAKGSPKKPRLDVQLKGEDLRAADQNVRKVSLQLQGGPSTYRLRAAVDMKAMRLHARANGRLEGEGLALDATVDGKIAEHKVALELEAPYLGFDGRVGSAGRCLGEYGKGLSAPDSRTAVQVHAEGIDLALLSDLVPDAPALSGLLGLTLHACGDAEQPRLHLDLTGKQITLPDRPALDVDVTTGLDASEGRAQIALRVRSKDALDASAQATATFSKRVRTPLLSRLQDAKVEGDFELSQLPIPFIERVIGVGLPTVGSVGAQAKVSGSLEEHELDVTLTSQLAATAVDGDQTSTDFRIHGHYARDEASVSLTAHDRHGAFIDAQARMDAPGPSLLDAIERDSGLLHSAAYELKAAVHSRTLEELPLSVTLPREVTGLRYGLDLDLDHQPGMEPSASLQLKVSLPDPEEAQNQNAASVLTGYRCTAGGSELDGKAVLQAGKLTLKATGQRDGVRVLSAAAKANLPLIPTLRDQEPPALAQDAFEVLLLETPLSRLPYACALAGGVLSGKVEGKRLLTTDPSIVVAKVDARALRVAGTRGIDVHVDGKLKRDALDASVELRRDAARSTIRAQLPLAQKNGGMGLSFDAPLRANVHLDSLPLTPLFPLGGPISQARGTLSGDVHVRGTARDPQLKGKLTPKGVGLTITSLAQPLRNVTGSLAFTENFLRIEDLRAEDGDGSLRVNGEARLRMDDSNKPMVATEIDLEASDFPLRSQGQPVGEVSAKVHVQGGMGAQRTGLQVEIKDGSVWLDSTDPRTGISLAPDPDIIDPRREQDAAQREKPSHHELRLRLSTDKPIWVQRDDFAVRLSAELDAQVVDGKATVTGDVRFRRGYLQLLGATFDLDSSSRLRFVGASPPDPALSIKASTINRRTGSEVEVRIEGRSSSPNLTFAVDGQETSAGDAAKALLGQGGSAQTSESASQQAQTFVAGVVASMMAISARRELGDLVPILMVEPQTATQSTRVRAGFELDKLVPPSLDGFIRGVYLEGIFTGSEGQNSSGLQGGVHLELYLPYDFVAEGQYGPGQTFSLDLGWQP